MSEKICKDTGADISPGTLLLWGKARDDYEDAREAYKQVLGQTAATVPVPEAFKSQYSLESGGHGRAGTDRWLNDNHPGMGSAARRLAQAEAEFQALDENVSGAPQPQCDLSTYVADKVREYYAMLEMVYLLATDAKFREQAFGIVSQNPGCRTPYPSKTVGKRITRRLSKPEVFRPLRVVSGILGWSKITPTRWSTGLSSHCNYWTFRPGSTPIPTAIPPR